MVPALPGSPGKRALNGCVCVCVCVCSAIWMYLDKKKWTKFLYILWWMYCTDAEVSIKSKWYSGHDWRYGFDAFDDIAGACRARFSHIQWFFNISVDICCSLEQHAFPTVTCIVDFSCHCVHAGGIVIVWVSLSVLFVVWPIMSYFADWLKCSHVTLIIIIWSTRHGRLYVIIMINGQVTVYHYNDTRSRDVH